MSWKGCTESGVGWGASRAARQRQSPRVLVQNGNKQQKRQTRMRVGVRTVWEALGVVRMWRQALVPRASSFKSDEKGT